MKQFGKRSYLDTLEEMVDPSRAALLVINMQNDQCSPNGRYAKVGINISMHREMIPRIAKLIRAARSAGTMVVYLQHAVAPGFINDSPAQIRKMAQMGADPDKPLDYHNIKGEWGYKIIDELNPQSDDFVVEYDRPDPFIASTLEQLLRSHGKESAILCGNETQGVVWITSLGVSNRDFYRVMVKDCVASTNLEYHEFIMKLIRERIKDYFVPEAAEIEAIWANKSTTAK
jgi:nicotinamidase-related amidase